MKKTSLFLVVVLAAVIGLTMASCASFMDEVVMGTFRAVGNEFTQTVSLIGTWVSDDGFAMTFNSNGTGTQQLMDFYDNNIINDSEFTWTTDRDDLTITREGSSYTVKYSIDGNTLTMEASGMSITRTRR